ncbi:ornithine cyclodeaminase family protein [Pseudorhodoferax sp.]|uniref:ornithine cyclodeaminase family protein n=1 Tax=Pseudorhodoferax sp. TaxID=1993553 RepID=UPI002DD69D2F|nr:ornithine cyclodeaminase family protein [Pseudorhodoferax sp.]
MRHFDTAATRAGLPYDALVPALRRMFAGGCEVPLRHTHALADADGHTVGTLLLMPAWRPGGRLGIKTVNVFPGNALQGLPALHAVYTLFDGSTGVPLAQMDGSEITTRRTVAASALAASYLAREDARELLLVGAGRLAHQVPAALRSVRPGLRRVRVWNHRPEGAALLVRALATEPALEGLQITVATGLEAAVRQADMVSCVTLSTAALVQGRWLRPGSHLDLVGGFTPAMRECDGEALRRARVWVDTSEAMAKAGDILQAVAEGLFDPAALQGTLADLCRGAAGRAGPDEITLFKSVGTALEDLAAAELVFDRG